MHGHLRKGRSSCLFPLLPGDLSSPSLSAWCCAFTRASVASLQPPMLNSPYRAPPATGFILRERAQDGHPRAPVQVIVPPAPPTLLLPPQPRPRLPRPYSRTLCTPTPC